MSDIISTLTNRCDTFSDRFGPIRLIGRPNITASFFTVDPIDIVPNITATFTAVATNEIVITPELAATFFTPSAIDIDPNLVATFTVR